MTTLPLQPNPSRNEAPNTYAGRAATSTELEIVHELMNQLTAINLCTSRLRSSADPSELTMLERIVESTVTTARRLASEMNR